MFSFLNRFRRKDNQGGGGSWGGDNQTSQQASSSAISSDSGNSNQSTQQQNQSTYIPMSSSTNKKAAGYNSSTQQAQRPTQQIQQQPQPQPQPQPNPLRQQLDQNVMSRANRTNERLNQTYDSRDRQQQLQAELANSRIKTLGDISGMAQQQYGNYADQVRQGVDLQKNTADRQIGRQQQIYDDQRFNNEQSRRERMKGLENTLAGLGTLQSSSMMNVGARVNQGAERQDRMAGRAMQDRVADIQDGVMQAQQQAETLLQQEGAQLQQYLRQLQGSMDTTSLEYRQAVSALEDQAQQRVSNILDSYDSYVDSANAQAYEMQVKAAQGQEGLSDQFLQTGQPVTREDLIWMAENPDKAETFSQKASGELDPGTQAAINTIGELLKLDTSRMTGADRFRGLNPFDKESQYARNLMESLRGQLTLENVSRLKGAISEKELALLERAATALDTNLDDQTFRLILQDLQDQFGGNTASQDDSSSFSGSQQVAPQNASNQYNQDPLVIL